MLSQITLTGSSEVIIQLGRCGFESEAFQILAFLDEANPAMPPRGKWKNLGDVALEQGCSLFALELLLSEPAIVAPPSCSLPGDFTLAKRCFSEAKDTSISKCSCCQVGQMQYRFQDLGALFLLYTSVGDAEGVLNTGKLAEASFLDRCISSLLKFDD